MRDIMLCVCPSQATPQSQCRLECGDKKYGLKLPETPSRTPTSVIWRTQLRRPPQANHREHPGPGVLGQCALPGYDGGTSTTWRRTRAPSAPCKSGETTGN